MPSLRHFLTATAFAACATAAAAQYPQSDWPQAGQATPYFPPAAPLTDADLLAQELRTLAADPTNLYALINAGKLSLKLGDTDGAAALYTRADKVAPGNPQVRAGMARLLVNAQRPGEALRMFREAAQAGAGERDFGPDRALAYDLIGEQERAQREYRALLREGPDDETTRRYALSLGISGLKDPALALLEPLNRRSDRGAWRARAFVLAMNGDRAGAEQIARTMMPPGMAEGLRPFFDRLPALGATDRAFAVHFGEVRGNAARIADARRAPSLPALSPEPNPFPPTARAAVQVAANDTKSKRGKKDKRAPAVTRVASAPYTAPLPPPPAPTATQLAALGSTRLAPPAEAFGARATASNRGVTVLPPPADAYRPAGTQLAANLPTSAGKAGTSTVIVEDSGDDEPETPLAPPVTRVTTVPTSLAGTSAGANAGSIARPGFTQLPAAQLPAAQPALAPATLPAAVAPIAIAPTITPTVTPAPSPAATSGGAAIASFAQPPAQTLASPPVAAAATMPPATTPLATMPSAAAIGTPPPPKGESGDAVLAAIMAGINVPDRDQPPVVTLPPGPAPLGQSKLLTTIEKKADVAAAKLPPKDARGRYLDAKGRPLLDVRGRPLDAKAAAAWKLAQDEAAAPKLRRDARGRYVDARGRPLLDARGRPLDAKAAAAKLAAADDTDDAALRKDARGRYLDAKGRPLLDARGRPLDAKAATAKLAAADDADDPKLKRDARGRYLDAKGKPLLDARGRPLDAKAATAKLAADAKKKPEPSAKAEPSRFWVQVAGGANEDTLAKEWKRVSTSAPALRGKSGWTTPLRATNRVLTGPFKSSAEAMALVNTLKGQGVNAFMFTSDPGQKVTRLGAE